MMEKLQIWLVGTAGLILTLIICMKLERFFRRRPCWFFDHKKKHLSIEKRYWPSGICHRCDESLIRGNHIASYRHEMHIKKTGQGIACFVTKWICAKDGCGAMGYFCVGDEEDGAWTIQHGEIVPDEKEWSKWKQT